MTHAHAPLDLHGLISAQVPGYALQREFYTDPAIFERDMERMLLRHWFCAGHCASVPDPGDYLLVELGAESVIIVRTLEGEIRALVNVCRHRGSRICTLAAGKAPAGRFTCPYHAWSYDLNGALRAAHEMPDGFDRGQFALKSLPVRVVEGLIFTTFAERPLDFASAAHALSRSAGVHGWGRAKIAHRVTYSVRANWKLLIENYMECYHCLPAHPEFSVRHVYARPAHHRVQLEAIGRRRAEALGVDMADIDEYAGAAAPGSESVSVLRSVLADGVASATRDNRPIARLMGDFTQHDGNSTYFDVGPISDFLAYADHGLIYRFMPRSVQHTQMEVIWLVHADAVEGRDYDLHRLTWLWHTTSLEDKTIVELNQAGVNSRFYLPGPYSLQESYPQRFVDRYLKELAGR